MIDPADRLLSVFREGDDDVLPSPTGGDDGFDPVTDYAAEPDKAPVIYRPFLLSLSAAGSDGDRAQIDASDRPEYWSISGCSSGTNTEVWIWIGDSALGTPDAIIAGNGYAKISGIYHRVYLESRGSSAVRVLVRAVRGYQFVESRYGG